MENKNADEFDKLIEGYKYMKLRMIQQAAAMALAFFKQSFTNQGFTDVALVPWKRRIPGTPNDKGRAIEVQRGILKRGLRIKRASIDGAIVGPDEGIPYAEIQNYGGQIPITPQMRRFFWAMYYQNQNGKVYNTNTKQAAKTNRNVALDNKAQFYKNMALTKEQFITIPARQFIGDSQTLDRQITNYVITELNKFFKIE
jgi:phage gpG-like protein